MNTIIALICIALILYLIWDIYVKIISPKILFHGITEINRNPKWVTTRLHDKYYGFQHIDIITCISKYGNLPYIRFNIPADKLEIWISDDTSVDDVEKIGCLALHTILNVKYKLLISADKPLFWLSILLFMLDGGSIKVVETPKQ